MPAWGDLSLRMPSVRVRPQTQAQRRDAGCFTRDAGLRSRKGCVALSRSLSWTRCGTPFSSLWIVFRGTAFAFLFAMAASPSPTVRTLSRLEHGRPDIDPQALFDYFYFHVIPAPRTVFEGVERVRAGHTIELSAGGSRTVMHWRPIFEERHPRPFEELKVEFRSLIENAVRHEAAGPPTGCFLSGGTDSSTVAGMLSRIVGGPAPTFSIGFDAEGYDEMAYARLAARHFGAEHHEHYISCDDLLEAIPQVAAWYDQPFGNSSAVPAYYCATLAKSTGIEKLLAGDGGTNCSAETHVMQRSGCSTRTPRSHGAFEAV